MFRPMRVLTLLALVALAFTAPAGAAPREGYIKADDGTKLFYKIEGSGQKTLVVVHGGPGGSLESVRPDFGRLAKGRTVIYYDQRGNGRSDLVDDEAKLAVPKHIADLDAVRRHFKLKKLTLLGNSWGGFLIAAYASAHPDKVERLILDVPAPPHHAQLAEMADDLDRRVQERMKEADRRRLGQLFRAWQDSDDPATACRAFYEAILLAYSFNPREVPPHKGELCAGNKEAIRRQQMVNRAIWRSIGEFDYREAGKAVKAPVLVIHGAADSIPLQGSEDWAASFPNARLLVIQGTGHLAHLEQPDAFFTAVDQFLAGQWPAQAEER